jgi:hypothetical protein
MKFISYFYEFYFIFYAFYKFIRISGLLKEIGKQKKKHRTATGRPFGPWPDVVGLAHGQGSLLALAARSPGGGHPTWRGCRRRLSGASDAGSAAREPGKTQGHAGRGGEGRFSPRQILTEAACWWFGGGKTMALQRRWNSSGRRRPPGGSAARGGEGEGEAGHHLSCSSHRLERSSQPQHR